VSFEIDPGKLPREDCDYLILGAGVAGGRAAMELAGHGRVVVVAKDTDSSASVAAQGGIAAALSSEDSPRQHALDTIQCGRGLVEEKTAHLTTEEGRERVLELLELGCKFDRDSEGAIHLTREGGHSKRRILHALGDRTGQEIVRVLASRLRDQGLALTRAEMAVDLVLEGSHCMGAVILFSGESNFRYVRARSATILATGGLGALFTRHSNPSTATGDGLAMALRAGAEVADLEFVQFHPTIFYSPGRPGFLISEAVRGEGGVLKNRAGYAFMSDYAVEADLAPRDVTSRAIFHEEAQGRGPVHLDISHMEASFEKRFPGISAWLNQCGCDPSKGIPVSIGAHFAMGGVVTDLGGQTSIQGLLAAGEVACTGLHGANRMGSNSLLEGLVFGRRSGLSALSMEQAIEAKTPKSFSIQGLNPKGLRQLQEAAWQGVGMDRRKEGLEKVLALVKEGVDEDFEPSRKSIEMRNAKILTRYLALAALERQESRGAHQRRDYPETDPAWSGVHLLWSEGKVRKSQALVPPDRG